MDIKHTETFSFDFFNLFYTFNFSFFIAQSVIWTYLRTFPVLTAFYFTKIAERKFLKKKNYRCLLLLIIIAPTLHFCFKDFQVKHARFSVG